MFNTEVLKTLFHKGDQRMLDVLADIEGKPDEVNEKCPDFKSMKYSIVVNEGIAIEDYDFNVSLGEGSDEYTGFEARDLRVVGTAAFGDDEREVPFTAPVDTLRMSMEFVPEDNPDVVMINKKATKPTVKEFSFEVGTVAFEDASIAADCGAAIIEGVKEGVNTVYDGIWSANIDYLQAMPVESLLPLVLIRHVGGFAMDQSLTSQALEYGFDPEMLFERIRPTPKKKKELLKEIHSEFSQPKEGEDPAMISLIIDENAINTFLLEFVLIERAFSLRDYLKADPRLAAAMSELNTQNMAVILPQVVEEFGSGRPIDLYFSLSHSLVHHKLDGVKPTGFQMDKNGNFKFVLNFSLQLLIEKETQRGQWDEGRSMFMSFTIKGKITTNKTSKSGEQLLSIYPKSAELSQLKVFDKDEKEIELEQMLLTSGFNMQMDTLMKIAQPFEMPMKNLPIPPEMECLGIAPSDLRLNFKKGYCEISCGYKKIDTPSKPEVCDVFIKALQEGPKAAQEAAESVFGGMSPQEFLDSKKRELEDSYGRAEDEAREAEEAAAAAEAEEKIVIEEL